MPTNKLYGSSNALWVTGLIIDSVHFLTEKYTHFIKWDPVDIINWAALER